MVTKSFHLFEIENLRFELPSFTILSGPMAAAKPIFAQKFMVKWINTGGKAIYFATSSPINGAITNLKILGIDENKIKNILFFDYDPNIKRIEKISHGYKGNFSDENQLKYALNFAKEKLVIIPSFTLLLVGVKDEEKIVKTLIDELIKKPITSFIAVNSAVFRDINKMLENAADNVIEFIKKEDKIYIKILKFKGEYKLKEQLFDFPINLFYKTKKEVAERTSRMIRDKKKAKRL